MIKDNWGREKFSEGQPGSDVVQYSHMDEHFEAYVLLFRSETDIDLWF